MRVVWMSTAVVNPEVVMETLNFKDHIHFQLFKGWSTLRYRKYAAFPASSFSRMLNRRPFRIAATLSEPGQFCGAANKFFFFKSRRN